MSFSFPPYIIFPVLLPLPTRTATLPVFSMASLTLSAVLVAVTTTTFWLSRSMLNSPMSWLLSASPTLRSHLTHVMFTLNSKVFAVTVIVSRLVTFLTHDNCLYLSLNFFTFTYICIQFTESSINVCWMCTYSKYIILSLLEKYICRDTENISIKYSGKELIECQCY